MDLHSGCRNLRGGFCDNSHSGDVHNANFSTHRSNCSRNSYQMKETIPCRENCQIPQTNNLYYSVASHSGWHLCKSLRGKAIGTSSMATGGTFGCATCCCYGTLRLGIMFDATTMETNQDNLHRGGGTEHSHTTSHTERNNGTARCRSKFSALNTGRHYCKFVSYDRDDYPFNKQEMLQKDTIH